MPLEPLSAAVGLLAHQGGWDEVLMVVVPVAIFIALLRTANQRAKKEAAAKNSKGSKSSMAGKSGKNKAPRGPL